MVLSGGMDPGITMASGGSAGLSHQAVPPQGSSSASKPLDFFSPIALLHTCSFLAQARTSEGQARPNISALVIFLMAAILTSIKRNLDAVLIHIPVMAEEVNMLSSIYLKSVSLRRIVFFSSLANLLIK